MTGRDMQAGSGRHPFHRLLPQQVPVLRRRALKLPRNQDHAEDLLQDTLLKAWAKRDSFRTETQLRAWLFTILRNTFFSDMRKASREVEDIGETLASARPWQRHRITRLRGRNV